MLHYINTFNWRCYPSYPLLSEPAKALPSAYRDLKFQLRNVLLLKLRGPGHLCMRSDMNVCDQSPPYGVSNTSTGEDDCQSGKY